MQWPCGDLALALAPVLGSCLALAESGQQMLLLQTVLLLQPGTRQPLQHGPLHEPARCPNPNRKACHLATLHDQPSVSLCCTLLVPHWMLDAEWDAAITALDAGCCLERNACGELFNRGKDLGRVKYFILDPWADVVEAHDPMSKMRQQDWAWLTPPPGGPDPPWHTQGVGPGGGGGGRWHATASQ